VAGTCSVAIVSDIHYASAAEQARGNDYELRAIENRLLRICVRLYRDIIWKRRPLHQNHLLDQFLLQASDCEYAVANGDYSCNSGFVGVSDEAALQSARECLEKLRQKFGANLKVNIGDHELGKMSFFGGRGGMRLKSWYCARKELGLEPLWRLDLGSTVLLGLVSSLIALPLFEPDTLPAERGEWQQLREEHLMEIRKAFASLKPHQRLLLFCHDPTALPFLWREQVVQSRLPQLEQTTIGHLHSNLVFWQSRIFAGMPRLHFLGHTAKRLSGALREARYWRPFKVRLCPALGGIELLKDGGFYVAHIDPAGQAPTQFEFHRLKPRP